MIPIEVQDYKLTSAWSIALEGGIKQDWVNQLNCYAWLLRENGYDPQKLTVVAFLRDWSKLEAKRKPDYPQSQVMVIDVPMWPADKATEYVERRVAEHEKRWGILPKCTPDERWERPTKYAVMKEGRKSALRVLDSRQDAMQWARDNGYLEKELIDEVGIGEHEFVKGLKPFISIVERPGEAVRCESYCNAARWCPQFQQEKADGAG